MNRKTREIFKYSLLGVLALSLYGCTSLLENESSCIRSDVYPIVINKKEIESGQVVSLVSETLRNMGFSKNKEKYYSNDYDCFVKIGWTKKDKLVVAPYINRSSSSKPVAFSREFQKLLDAKLVEDNLSDSLEISEEIILRD